MLNDNKNIVRFVPGKDIVLNVNLNNSKLDQFDFKESHENLLGDEKDKTINPILDGEIVKYQCITSNSCLFTFLYNGSSTYINAGFSSGEITDGADSFVNSNYFYHVYDSIDGNNQTLLHTGYINGYQVLSTSVSSQHRISRRSESFSVYLPESFLNTIETLSFTLYFKFHFYNAKTGRISPFTQNSTTLTSESQFYFPIQFTKASRTHNFPSSMTLRELPASQFTNNLNDNLGSFKIERPNLPEFDKFGIDGTYS